MSALLKIQQAGFELSIERSGKLGVVPASKLTDELRKYIRSHKAEILTELEAANDGETKFKRFVVTRDGEPNNVIVCGGMTLTAMRNKFAKSTVDILYSNLL